MNAPSPTGEVFEMVNCGGVVSRAPSVKHVEEVGSYFAFNDKLERIIESGRKDSVEEPRRWEK
jgi:hypothetical protein